MSEIYLDLIIANIKDPERQQEVSLLVDTGATKGLGAAGGRQSDRN